MTTKTLKIKDNFKFFSTIILTLLFCFTLMEFPLASISIFLVLLLILFKNKMPNWILWCLTCAICISMGYLIENLNINGLTKIILETPLCLVASYLGFANLAWCLKPFFKD